MSEEKKDARSNQRHYPAVYEKIIPIAIAVIVILIAGMLALSLGIAAGVIGAG